MNLKNVDLNLLRAFDVLVTERSVSRAAQKLFLSQPATSALLSRLRDVFRDPLLVRGGRGMVPTERALELAGPIRRVLEDIHGIMRQHDKFDPAHSTRTFAIGTTEYVANILFPVLAEKLQSSAPGVRIALVPVNADTLVRDLENGTLDIAILNETLIPSQLRSCVLFKDGFSVIARRGHPRIKKRMTLDVFCSLPHVVISPRGGSFQTQTDDALESVGRKRFVRLSVPHFSLVVDLVAHSDMLAVYPQRLTRLVADRVQAFKPPVAVPPVVMRACWHDRSQKNPAHQWLCEAIMDCVKQAPVSSRLAGE